MARCTRKITLIVAATFIGVVGWIAYHAMNTVRHLPEAYAAWDTGTLLIEYMKQHADHWPRSWGELVEVVVADSDRKILLRGAQAGDVLYAQSLKEKVLIDWAFDPSHPDARNPVTQMDGKKFSVVWSDAEPNQLVRDYLAERAATRPAATH